MKWHKTDWPLLRDVGITGTALVVIWVQLGLWAVLGRTPSPPLLYTSLTMLAPTVWAHVRHILQSAGSSSSQSPSHSQSPSQSSSSQEVGTGEH